MGDYFFGLEKDMEKRASRMPKEAAYKKIARDIARKITTGEYEVGSKLRGRSVLASAYNVSSETVRKAIVQLSHYEVVIVKQSSGIYITSKENAEVFLKDHEKQKEELQVYDKMSELLKEMGGIREEMVDQMTTIRENVGKTRTAAYRIFSLFISVNELKVFETIRDLDFIEKERGLVIGIKRDLGDIVMPEKNVKLMENDRIYFSGFMETEQFLYMILNEKGVFPFKEK